MFNMLEHRQTTVFDKNSFSKDKLTQSVEDYKLSLRKQKMLEHLSLKRNIPQSITQSTAFLSFFNLASIPNDVKDCLLQYDKDTISQLIEKCSIIAKRIIQYMSNPNTLGFLLEHLNKILILIPIESLALIGITKLIEALNGILSQYKTNPNLIDLTITSLIKLSMSSDRDFIEKFITVPFLQIYISILEYTNKLLLTNLTSHFLLFLSNIVSENEYIQGVFYSYEIFNLIASKLSESEECSNNDLKAIIWFLACFSSSKSFPNTNCALQLQIIFSYLVDKAYCDMSNGINSQIDNTEILSNSLWGLFFVYFHQDADLISEDNFTIGLIEEVIDCCEYLNKGYYLPLGMLGNITSRNDNTICNRAYNSKIADFIINCLKNRGDSSIRIRAIWVATNLAIGTRLKCLLQYDLYNRILSLIKEERDNKVQYEFIDFIINCLTSYDRDSFNECEFSWIFNAELLLIILNMMTNNNNNEILLMLVETLCSFNIDKIINSLKKIGVIDYLDKCNHMPNEEIQVHSNHIMEKYFKEIL